MLKLSCLGIMVLLLLCLVKVNGQDYAKVDVVETINSLNIKELYPNPKELEKVNAGLSLIENFLKKRDLSNIHPLSDIARDILKYLFQFNPQNSLYEVAAITRLTTDQTSYSVNAYFIFGDSPVKMYRGFLELVVDSKKKRIIFPVYSPLYTVKNYKNISYYCKKSALAGCLPYIKKGDSYISRTIKSIKDKCPDFISPQKPLKYVIANGYFNGLEYFGVHNYMITSRFLRTSNTVVDLSAKGFYKHEIIHYVFSNYNFCYFLNEGIATFLSGGEARYRRGGVDDTGGLREIQDRIKTDKKFASYLNNKDSLFSQSSGSDMYLISALLMHDYCKKVGNIKFYKALTHDLVKLSNEEALQFFKQELNFTQLSDYILAAAAPFWSQTNDHSTIN